MSAYVVVKKFIQWKKWRITSVKTVREDNLKRKMEYKETPKCNCEGLFKSYYFEAIENNHKLRVKIDKIYDNLSHAVCYGINGDVTEEELEKIERNLKLFVLGEKSE